MKQRDSNLDPKSKPFEIELKIKYNNHAATMESFEPGQGRKTAALRGSFMCGSLLFK